MDVSNPAGPTEVGFYATPGGAMDVAGHYAYVAAGKDGRRILDMANPAAPIEMGFYATEEGVRGVVMAGDPSTGSSQLHTRSRRCRQS